MLFAYAIYRLDPVFMLGQGMGLLIYARNIYIIRTHRGRGQRPAPGSAGRPRRLNGLDGGGTRVDEAAIRRHLPPVTTF